MTVSLARDEVDRRHREILLLTHNGQSASEIAEILGVSRSTVDSHRRYKSTAPDTRFHHKCRTETRDWPAACKDHDPELWFPLGNEARKRKQAKEICESCPLYHPVTPDRQGRYDPGEIKKNKCLQYAIDTDTRWGIWGGKTEREREKITGRRP